MKIIKQLDGNQLEEIYNLAYYNLKRNERIVNLLNVFPVPDGDTGTNMCLTFKAGLDNAHSDKHLGAYLKSFSKGMLFGARGNSGVILSQIFKGASKYLFDFENITPNDFLHGLEAGYNLVYGVIEDPQEGTILTVLKQSVVDLLKLSFSDFNELFTALSLKMKEILNETPEMLPVLKEAGVVDSGGAGLYIMIEGMKSYFNDNKQSDLFSYQKKEYHDDKFREISYVVFTSGNALCESFSSLGGDLVINTKGIYDITDDEFKDILAKLNCHYVILVPNNDLLYKALNKKVQNLKLENVKVIDTKNALEGYFAMQMVVKTDDNLEHNIKNMQKGIEELDSYNLVNDNNRLALDENNCYAIYDNKVFGKASNIMSLIENIIDDKDYEFALILYGASVTDEQKEAISNIFMERDIELTTIDCDFDEEIAVIGVN